MEHLKSVVPEAFADGKINWEILKESLGSFIEDDEGEVEHYAFTWPGKRQARRLAGKPPQGTLVPEPGEGINEESTENIFIEGDNLEVLKLLQKSYAGKIKMIYIDPPYNTGNDFIYNDNFTTPLDEYLKLTGQIDEKGSPLVSNKKSDGRFHSKWMNMMYPRLLLGKNLLNDDGVIFISIDDNEIENLKKICGEIFGEENFIGTFTKQSKVGGGSDSKYIAKEHEYMIVFAKNIDSCPEMFEPHSEEYLKRYKEEDSEGRFFWDTLARPGLKNPINYDIKAPDGSIVNGDWIWSKKRFEEELKNKNVRIVNKKDNSWSVQFKQRLNLAGKKPRSMTSDFGGTIEGKKEVSEIFGSDKIFSYPKSVKHIKKILEFVNDKNSTILDFFAGSATTAHAVLDMNREDGGKRKFIMIQLPEVCEDGSEAYKAGFKTIADISKERISRVIKKIVSENDIKGLSKIDVGFKVFKLQKSHFNEWQDYKGSNVNELMDLFAKQEDALVEGWKPEDLIVEIMLQEGFPLHSKISTMDSIKDNKVIQVKSEFCNHVIFICLDEKVGDKTINDLPLTDKDIFICVDKALTDQQKVSLSDKGVIKTI
jgi:adenine-specific DNA-methyltransferase